MGSGVQRVSVAGSWWRQTPHGADPLWLAFPPSSGRWQRGSSIAAIYFADEEETAWAEWYRVLAEIALPPTHGMPRDLWRWTVAVNDIADLSTPAKLAKLGLPVPRPATGWVITCAMPSTAIPSFSATSSRRSAIVSSWRIWSSSSPNTRGLGGIPNLIPGKTHILGEVSVPESDYSFNYWNINHEENYFLGIDRELRRLRPALPSEFSVV